MAGSPDTLYANASRVVSRKIASSVRWPKTTREFSIELRRIAPQLALHGLIIEFGKKGQERHITITLPRALESHG